MTTTYHIKLNLNQIVRVRLKDAGRDLLRQQHFAMRKKGWVPPYVPPQEDENRWSRWELHRLAFHFGSYMFGFDWPYFETDMEIVIRAEDGLDDGVLRRVAS